MQRSTVPTALSRAVRTVPPPSRGRSSTISWSDLTPRDTHAKVRPEPQKALALAHQFKAAAPETPVIFTVHKLKRLARNAAELMTLSTELQAGGIQLELLTGPLTVVYEPNGMGAMFFAALAARPASFASTTPAPPV
ncbi:recombinase family protein [Streptomyces inhibens]|uniref:recombinase family protein n=1 Tax=Streptomyces inhibens TaxID=2293571 RepID=UPI00368EA563